MKREKFFLSNELIKVQKAYVFSISLSLEAYIHHDKGLMLET